MKKRAYCFLLAAVFSFGALCSCAANGGNSSSAAAVGVSISAPVSNNSSLDRRLVGISMPVQEGNWEQEAVVMQRILEKKGYIVELAYAGNDSDVQSEQVRAMLDDDCGAIILAAVDSKALVDTLATCDTSSTTIIAYTALLSDSKAVDYYIGSDCYASGQAQGNYLVKKLGLKKTKKHYNLELFHYTGNGNSLYTFLGALDILQPYLGKGTLVIPSGQMTPEECSVSNAREAGKRLNELLKNTYSDGMSLDAILCTDDTISVGVAQQLERNFSGSVFPVICGSECNSASIQLLMDGQLAITSVTEMPGIAKRAAMAADQAMSGQKKDQLEENIYGVPVSLYQPARVTKKNCKKALFDSGLFVKNKNGVVLPGTKTEN